MNDILHNLMNTFTSKLEEGIDYENPDFNSVFIETIEVTKNNTLEEYKKAKKMGSLKTAEIYRQRLNKNMDDVASDITKKYVKAYEAKKKADEAARRAKEDLMNQQLQELALQAKKAAEEEIKKIKENEAEEESVLDDRFNWLKKLTGFG